MEKGDSVRRKGNPGVVGQLTGHKEARGSRVFWKVNFGGRYQFVPEAELELFEPESQSLLDSLRTGRLATPQDLRRCLTHIKLSGNLANMIYSMEATNTDFHAFQFKPVLKILESPSGNLLIADEVGLGKTIEAGLIWTELQCRYRYNRLLVLCPKTLREKWQRELLSKFNVKAKLADARDVLAELEQSQQSNDGFACVASIQGLRPPRDWEDPDTDRTSAKLARFLRDAEPDQHLIDLLVIDEAHHLRNPNTQTKELADLLQPLAEHIVFLSATPVHNQNTDLLTLLSLLDPETFEHPGAFDRIIEANRPLISARDLLRRPPVDAQQIRNLIDDALAQPLLFGNRQLGAIRDRLNRLNGIDLELCVELASSLDSVNLLSHVVSRTRKRDVQEWRVVRQPYPQFVDMSSTELAFYRLVTDTVTKYAEKMAVTEHFLLAQPQRMMTSCMAAALGRWLAMDEDDHEEDEGEQEDQEVMKRQPLLATIRRRVREDSAASGITVDRLRVEDSKYSCLLKALRSYFDKHPNEKIVLFTTFIPTREYLHTRLQKDGINCLQLSNDRHITKDQVIESFRENSSIRVLLSTEVGGEGVDLQFSRVVINYDLPWNPMKIEQRIGRVDRIGQEADSISIWSILFNQSIDAKIYDKLYHKLGLIKDSLGDFEEILGKELRKLEGDLLSGRLTDEEQELRIMQTSLALEEKRTQERQLEENAHSLLAYGDYVLEQIKSAKQMKRWVSGSDLKYYVLDFIRTNYPAVDYTEDLEQTNTGTLRLPNNFISDFMTYLQAKDMRGVSTSLTRTGTNEKRVAFDIKTNERMKNKGELINQHHPLVTMINDKLNHMTVHPVSAIRLKQSTNGNFSCGLYVVGIHCWAFSGFQTSRLLAYEGRCYATERKILSNEAEVLVQQAMTYGDIWHECSWELELESLTSLSGEILNCLYDRFDETAKERQAKNNDRVDMQISNLKARSTILRRQYQNKVDLYLSTGQEHLLRMWKGKLNKHEVMHQAELNAIQVKRNMTAEFDEVAIALIKMEK